MEANDILNDESKNDKELIKDLSVFIKHHKDNKLPINKAFVNGIIDIVLKNSEINYNGVNYAFDGGIAAYGLYDNDKFEINITEMLYEAEHMKKEELKTKEGDNRIFQYYFIISSIVHEITHARQDYLNQQHGIDLYNSGFEFLRDNYLVYSIYHDDMLFEKYANIRGETIAYEALSYIYPKEHIHELRKTIFTYLLSGYYIKQDNLVVAAGFEGYLSENASIISALENYNKILSITTHGNVMEIPADITSDIKIEVDEDMPLYDRMYLGLPITMDEYRRVKEMYLRDIMEENDKTSSVKELIDKVDKEHKQSLKRSKKRK